MSSASAAPRTALPVSSARAEASRKNGAKSRGPKTPEGKARSSKNALKHGLRAVRHVVLPQEDAAAFADLQRTLLKELAPIGALQTALARRVAIAAWRLERADRMEAEALEFRSYDAANPGVALIRDGNATRLIETLLRYRNAAMAEFTRALRTLKALQAEGRAAKPPARKASALPLNRTNPREPAEAMPWIQAKPSSLPHSLRLDGEMALMTAPPGDHESIMGKPTERTNRARAIKGPPPGETSF